jgi:hypothetical protein
MPWRFQFKLALGHSGDRSGFPGLTQSRGGCPTLVFGITRKLYVEE